MAPTLNDGDYVIARRLGGLSRPPRVGDVVVLEPAPEFESRSPVWRSLSAKSMIKRVAEITSEGYRVAGDGATSLGAESFGRIVRTDIVARVWLRIPKNGPLGVVRHTCRASSRCIRNRKIRPAHESMRS